MEQEETKDGMNEGWSKTFFLQGFKNELTNTFFSLSFFSILLLPPVAD